MWTHGDGHLYSSRVRNLDKKTRFSHRGVSDFEYFEDNVASDRLLTLSAHVFHRPLNQYRTLVPVRKEWTNVLFVFMDRMDHG